MTPKQRLALVAAAGTSLVVAALVTTHVTSAAPPAAGQSTNQGPPSCRVEVNTENRWSNGFQATVTITNNGKVPLNNWYVAFMLPINARFASGWNGLWMDSGPSLMVHAPQWSQQLAPGATAVAGFVGTGSGAPTYESINCD